MNINPKLDQSTGLIRRKKGVLHEINTQKALYLMLLPGALLLLIYNYLPMFGSIIAFKYFTFHGGFISSIINSEWVGLQNFEFMFKVPSAFEMIRNTLFYNLAFIISCTLISISFAIMLNEIYSRKLAKLYQSSMFFPFFFSWVVFSYLVYSYLSAEKGFINMTLFKFLGLPPVAWYNDTPHWPYILILVNAWKWVGNNCIIYLAAIVSIDQELYEAARIDGANRWQQILKITIPQIQPVIIVMILVFVGRIFNTDLGLFFMVPKDSKMLLSVTRTMDTYVYSTLMSNGDIGMSSAGAFLQSIVGFFTIVVANLAVKRIDPDQSIF